MFRHFFNSICASLIITTLLALCCFPVFLTEYAQNTYYNRQAFLSFQVVNKETASFDFQTRRVKFYPSDTLTNSISATSKMIYINRKRNIDLTINSSQTENNNILCSFLAPDVSVSGNSYSPQILYSDIYINGEQIQKEILTSAQHPYQYLLRNIPNQSSVSISFCAKKPLYVSDINWIRIGFTLILIWGIICYWRSIKKHFSLCLNRLQQNFMFQKITNCYQYIFYHFSCLKFAVFFVLFYILFLLVNLQTPFHSDDWVQMDYGVSFYKAYYLWMTWSGRLVADTIARALLQLYDHRIILAMIVAIVPMITCALITCIPSKIIKQKPEPIIFVLTLLLYWICNPNLGQTTFWIVGMANYLWTCMMVLFFWYAYVAGYQKNSTWYRIVLFLTGLCAGCSNEHTALTMPFIILIAGYLMKKQYPDVKTTNTKIGFLSCFIGGTILMGAPGNYIRLKTETETLSFWRKIGKGIERLLRHFLSFIPVFGLLGIGAFLNKPQWQIQSKKPQPFWWGMLFVFAGCMSAGVMIFSPSASARTFNNSLIFFLLGLSFILQSPRQWNINVHLLKLIALIICGGIFVSSYACVLYSYHATAIQQKIRLAIIEKQKGIEDVIIPDFYFPKLRSDNDKFDMYHNVLGMATHFGMKHIYLNQEVNFDYGTLLTGKRIIPLNPISDTFIMAKSSNMIADGTIVVGTRNPNLNLEGCTLKIKEKNYKLPKMISLHDMYITGISVYQFDDTSDSVSITCPIKNDQEFEKF